MTRGSGRRACVAGRRRSAAGDGSPASLEQLEEEERDSAYDKAGFLSLWSVRRLRSPAGWVLTAGFSALYCGKYRLPPGTLALKSTSPNLTPLWVALLGAGDPVAWPTACLRPSAGCGWIIPSWVPSCCSPSCGGAAARPGRGQQGGPRGTAGAEGGKRGHGGRRRRAAKQHGNTEHRAYLGS